VAGGSDGVPIHQAAAAADSGGWLGKGKLAADRLTSAEGVTPRDGSPDELSARPVPIVSSQNGHRSGMGVPGRNGC
jgi:hypothetical protein